MFHKLYNLFSVDHKERIFLMVENYNSASNNKEKRNGAPSFEGTSSAPSSDDIRRNSRSIIDLYNEYATNSLTQSQKEYIDKIRDKLLDSDPNKTIEKEEISSNGYRSVIFYRKAEDESKLYVAFLLFAEGAELESKSYQTRQDARINLPILKFDEIISKFKATLVNKGINLPFDVVIDLVISERDIAENKVKAMADYIGNSLKFCAHGDNENINISLFNTMSFKVSTTSVSEVRNIIARNNPMATQPAMDIGFSIDVVSQNPNAEGGVISNFITVGAVVDIFVNPMKMSYINQQNNQRDLISVVKITALDSSLPMSSSIFTLAMIFAQQVFIESGLWKNKVSFANRENTLFTYYTDGNPPQILVNCTNEADYRRAMDMFIECPILMLDIPFGSYRPAILTKLVSPNLGDIDKFMVESVKNFFSPILTRNYRIDQANIQPINALLNEISVEGFRVFQRCANEYGGWYDDPHQGRNNDIRDVTYCNFAFATADRALDQMSEAEMSYRLINYNSKVSPEDHAIGQINALHAMQRASDQVRFSYVNYRLYMNANFQKKVYALCQWSNLSLQIRNTESYVAPIVTFDQSFYDRTGQVANGMFGGGSQTSTPIDMMFPHTVNM